MRAATSLFVLTLAIPAQTPDPAKPAPAKVDFEREVAPVLVAHCIECHGPAKQKGDLRLDAKQHVFPAGGEADWCIAPKDPDASELIARVELPADDEDRMPNKGEPLSQPQRELLRRWVAEGAEWPAGGDAAIAAKLAANELPKITFDLPAHDAAADAVIERAVAALRERGAVVQRIAADTPALEANLSLLRDKVTDADVDLLMPLAPVLVWLNLGRTAVTDASCAQIARLTELRRLDVGNTRLGDGGFAALGGLTKLEFLNAYGTQLGDDGLAKLAALPKLARLYAWQSKVSVAGKANAHARAAALDVDLGDYVEARLVAAQQEIAARDARNAPVNAKCPVSGEAIDNAQFVEFEGKRVAFCCAKCKAKFEQDPKAFADKLPAAGESGAKDAPKKDAGQGNDAPINDVCPVSGKPIDPAQFVDYEGRRVAFCCGNCKAKFAADPKAFADKLPKASAGKGKQ